MGYYFAVYTTFWTGETGRSIRQRGKETQILAAYLITSPHATIIGAYHLPIPYIVADTGLTMEEVSTALTNLRDVGFAEYDQSVGWVWVCAMLDWQLRGAGPRDKRLIYAHRCVADLPDCSFKAQLLDRYGTRLDAAPTGKRPRRVTPPIESTGSCTSTSTVQRERTITTSKRRGIEGASKPLTSPSEPFSLPPSNPTEAQSERAGAFVQWYQTRYEQVRNGSPYLLKPALDFMHAERLVATYPDDEWLHAMAEIYLQTDHRDATRGSRTIGQFTMMAPWCDQRLREAGHRPAVATVPQEIA